MNQKQKIEGVDDKELKAFIAIIGVIVVLLIFELFFFEGRPGVQEDNERISQQLQEMKEVTVEAEQKMVYKKVNEIVEKMNAKDYEWLYNNLKDDYKNYYFDQAVSFEKNSKEINGYDNFKLYIDTYAGDEYYPKYTSYYREGDLYYIIVDFMKAKYTREDLLNPLAIKVDTLVLEEVGKNEYKFAMNGFAENILHNKKKEVAGVTFELKNSVRNVETQKSVLLITNNSDKSLTISSDSIQPRIIGSLSAKVSYKDTLFLAPGESGIMSIEYYMQYNSNREFAGIEISGLRFDDGTVIEDILLEK